MTTGRLITFEGGEGAGKSTQAARLAQTLKQRGHTVLSTREPGGTEAAERIRALLLEANGTDWDPISETLLHFAARREHVKKVIAPALERETWVISDRFTDSTLAYQGHGAGGSITMIHAVAEISLGNFGPDFTLVLDIEAAAGLERARTRSPDRDRYENHPLDFHQRLREGFLSIAAAEPKRCAVIDASQDEDAVSSAVLVALDRFLTETGW